MRKRIAVLAAAALLAPFSSVHGSGGDQGFAFNADRISGFPSGRVRLAGGGAFDPGSGTAKAGGAFRCAEDVRQGPLAGLRAGEGVRWDAVEVLPSIGFKCSGSAAEPLKTAVTGGRTIVLRADFYRQGDGVEESFSAAMIVSANDLDPDLPGRQNVWIQGVGCGEAIVNFR